MFEEVQIRVGERGLIMPPILLDARELADRLEVTPGTVYDWERLGRIPSIRTGRRVMFNLDSVIRALRASAAGDQPALSGAHEAN
jgi:excisionase family DNA binding protein